MELIDTHQHLILRGLLGYGWTAAIPDLAVGEFGRAEYAQAAGGFGGATAGAVVVGAIFMETGVEDAEYRTEAEIVAQMIGTGLGGGAVGERRVGRPGFGRREGIAPMSVGLEGVGVAGVWPEGGVAEVFGAADAGATGCGAECGAMLGQVASIRPEVDAGFDDWLDQAGRLGVVGYRRLLHVADPAISLDPVFRRNLRKIGARGLPFDLCLFARQLGLAEGLLRACPDQVFVLDHCGNPEVGAGGFDAWAGWITRLARYPNLVVKLSGVTTNCAPGPVTVAALQPFVDHLLARFGPDRMLWGSDWPVVNLATGLGHWLHLTQALLSGLTGAERHAIAQGTARRVYRGLRTGH